MAAVLDDSDQLGKDGRTNGRARYLKTRPDTRPTDAATVGQGKIRYLLAFSWALTTF